MTSEVKILYVDDEQINLLFFRHVFKNKYNVLTAESGFEGLKVLAENPDIKVIISDMRMPGMDGLQFIRKAKEENPDILFYILTGYEITPEIQQALEEKLILKYLQKPFNVGDIESSISENLVC